MEILAETKKWASNELTSSGDSITKKYTARLEYLTKDLRSIEKQL